MADCGVKGGHVFKTRTASAVWARTKSLRASPEPDGYALKGEGSLRTITDPSVRWCLGVLRYQREGPGSPTPRR